MTEHPEYLYWLALAVLGVPAIFFARAVVPAMAIAIVSMNVLMWRIGFSWQQEGVLLSSLYAAAFTFSLMPKLGTAESFSAALWSPMMVVAALQALGADPSMTYWHIYGLAMLQALSFAFVGRWPSRIARGVVARIFRRNRDYWVCQA